MGKRKLTNDERALVHAAFLTREPIHSIARRFKIHTKTVAIIAARLGAPTRRSLSKKQTIIRLFPQGVPVREIARAINSRPGYVRQIAVECGLATPIVTPATQGDDSCAVQEARP
jgi:transposase-like protein